MFVHICAICKSLASAIRLRAQYTYFTNYIFSWHISPNKNGCLTANIGHNVLIFYGHRSNIGGYICHNTTKDNIYFTCYCQTCARNKFACQIAHLCHIFDGHIWEMYMHTCVIWSNWHDENDIANINNTFQLHSLHYVNASNQPKICKHVCDFKQILLVTC